MERVLTKYESYYKNSNMRPSIISDNPEYIEDNEVVIMPNGDWSYKRDEIDYDDK